ncbi:MAG: fasciclin domain-containing protein [Cyclobacteriaceae bacterium]
MRSTNLTFHPNKALALFLSFFISLTLFSCEEEEDDVVQIQDQTIAQQLSNSENYIILTAGLTKAVLLETLNAMDQNFTLLAPPDVAFINAGISDPEAYTEEEWRDILLYHLVGEEVPFSSLVDEDEVETENGMVYISPFNNNVVFNGRASIIETNLGAANGLIHTIDNVLLPPQREVSDIISDRDDLTTLQAAIERLNLAGELSQNVPYTIFAPSDEAFEELLNTLGAGGLSEIPDGQLAEILQYHVVSNRIFSFDLEEGNVNTLLGEPFVVSFDNGVIITDGSDVTQNSEVQEANILGTNGVVHIIDEVLLPE